MGRTKAKYGLGLAAAAVMVASCLPATGVMAADDSGIGAFFREQFGIGNDAPAVAAPQYDVPDDHPIVVRPRRTRSAIHHVAAKIAVGPVAPVSIYDDPTLKAGDAVMTKAGLRVFVGGHGAPYTAADFLALADADGLPKQTQKALLVIDKAPRG